MKLSPVSVPASVFLLFALAAGPSDASLIWQIGKADGGNSEFALAPNHYSDFREDGFFVVGRSDSQRDWPYVHPGPGDTWAGSRRHTFAIVFGIAAVPSLGECKLRIQLLDTHRQAPPQLLISLNGREARRRLTPGAGDDSVNGQPAKGKPCELELAFPANALKPGANEIDITSTGGSWMLYDAVAFDAPDGTRMTNVIGTTIASATSPPVLIERAGKLMQTIEIRVRHLGDETPAELRVGNLVTTNLTLRAPTQSFEIPLPAVQREQTVPVSVAVESRPIAARELVLKPVRKWVVYLLPHSHVDIGYTHVQTDVERAQWRYLEMGIEAARNSASYPAGSRFKWNTEVLWAVDSYLRQASPEKQRAFFDAVKAGWVGLDALYGNELTGLCRPEELLRLVSFAMSLSERTGVPIQSAMITDVPGYTWGIVPAFAQSGVKYFSMGPNGGDRIGHTIAAWGDKPFWWVGPNGKDKVLAWMTGTGYYRVFQSGEMLLNYLAGLDAKGYPYDMVQVRHCLGDNGAPDVNFADTVKQWNDTHAYPRLVIATTAEMFRDFERAYGDKLPVAQGDFTPYWEDGAASSARETSLNRASAERLVQAETLFAMLNPKAYPAEDFYQAWRNVILYDEHTWGAHNSISEPDAPFVKSQWAIKQAFALEGDKQSRELLRKAVQMNSADSQSGALDVFNTSSWERTDLVTVPPEIASQRNRVVDSHGRTLPSQRLSTGELVFLARQVPPFGAKRFRAEPGACPVNGNLKIEGSTLSSPDFVVRIDPQTGAIASLFSRVLKKELGYGQAATRLNEYFYLPGTDLKGLQRNGPVKISPRESGPLVASLLIESDAPGCDQLTREVRLIAGLDRVELIDVLDKKAVRAKEGVHLGFGFNVPNGLLRVDVPWAVVRTELDQIPGACKNWLPIQRWVDISNKDYGVTWATVDAPLIEVGAMSANLIGSLSDPKLWLEHLARSQTVYSWVMNNHWHTNYRAEQDGRTEFRYAIWAHKAFRPEQAERFGTDISQALIAAPAAGQSPSSPALRVESPGVQVTAFKPSQDGQAFIVRLFGASGKAEQAKLTFSASPKRTLWLSDNSEKPKEKVKGLIAVPAYGIVTLRAEMR